MSAGPCPTPRPAPGPADGRVADPRRAETVLARAVGEHRLDLVSGGPLDARIDVARWGETSVGRFGYGQEARMTHLAPSTTVQLDLVLGGRAVLTDGLGGQTTAEVGQGAVHVPGARPQRVLSADCVVLTLGVPPARLETEVTTLLGHPPARPVRFDFPLRLEGERGRRLLQLLDLVQDELVEPVLGRLDSADRHLETVVIRGLLAAQPHNHREAMQAPIPAAHSVAHRAVALVQADPGRAWTTSRLAAEVHLSVRALQESFSRELGVAPMPYVREVRLLRVRDALAHPTGSSTTVASVATRLGFTHLGRFAGHYSRRFGELPSTTLSSALERDAPT